MRFEALDGWRGLTAVLVVLFHIYVLHSLFMLEWLRYMAPILEFFFIVSGFVMALGFGDKVTDTKSFIGYLVRRGGRIWPMHLAMLALLLLIPLLRFVLQTPGDLFSGKLSLEALPAQVFLLQTWTPEWALTWNHPAWTLSGETFAYLLMGILVWVARKEPLRWVLSLIIIAIAGSFFYTAMMNSPSYNTTTISRAVTGFFVGFLLFHVWRRFPLTNVRVAQVLEVVIAVGFFAFLQWHPSGPAYFLSYLLYGSLIYVYAGDLGFMSRLLSTPPLKWLGKYSFSIYMFHGVVTTWIMLVVHFIEARIGRQLTYSAPAPGVEQGVHVVDLGQPWMNDLLVAAYFIVVLIGGRIVYSVVEAPSRDYFKGLSIRMMKRMPAKEAAKQPEISGGIAPVAVAAAPEAPTQHP
jgi:peptidoglycan/LPS O-acetylase OafA/YrhL